MARTWLELRSGCFFLAPKIRILARKSIFSYGNLFFRTATWVAQVVTQILRPTDLVYDFSFPSYARFREGTRPMPQKVFPHPTVRAPSASNSPSALSARAGYKSVKLGSFHLTLFWNSEQHSLTVWSVANWTVASGSPDKEKSSNDSLCILFFLKIQMLPVLPLWCYCPYHSETFG